MTACRAPAMMTWWGWHTLTSSHRDPALNKGDVLNIFARCSIVSSGVAIVLFPGSTVGRGDFQKKNQKFSAFWKMAAVTVIRLSGYERILSCNEQLCRQSHLGGEHSKQFLLNHLPKIWFYLVPCGLLPCLMSSCNTYTNMLMNQSTISDLLMLLHNI